MVRLAGDGSLSPISWERRWATCRRRVQAAHKSAAALVKAGRPGTRRATSSSGSCAGPSARHVDSRATRGRRRPARRAVAAGAAAPRCPTSTRRTPSSSSTATRSTRCRSSTCGSARRCGATGPSSWSPPRPTALDGGAEEVVRFAPGEGSLLGLAGGSAPTASMPRAPSRSGCGERGIAAATRRPESYWGERLWQPGAVEASRAVPPSAAQDGAGLIEVPAGDERRGPARGRLPPRASGPGSPRPTQGRQRRDQGRPGGPASSAPSSWSTSDPVRDLPDPEGWSGHSARRLRRLGPDASATSRPATPTSSPRRGVRREGGHGHASRRPAPARAPERRAPGRDPGRLAGPGGARCRLGDETGTTRAPRRSRRSPTKSRSTRHHAEEIGGTRRPLAGARRGLGDGPARAHRPLATTPASRATAPAPPTGDGPPRSAPTVTSGPARSTERNPALRFLAPKQTLELAPADAERLGRRPRRRGRRAVQRHERPGARRDPRADAARRRVPDRGHGENNANVLAGAPRSRSRRRAGRMTLPIADVDFAESTLDPDRQVDRDLPR